MSAELLIATWPCGCVGALRVLGYGSEGEANFYRENADLGAVVETVTWADYESRGGVRTCKHEPKWGEAS